jgi:hypothetical protein
MPNAHKAKPKPPPKQAHGGSGGGAQHPNALANLTKPWKPGESGNPGGRPKAIYDIMRLARSRAPEAVQTLYEIMSDKTASDRDRIVAAATLLDRGCGRAPVPVLHKGADSESFISDGSAIGDGEWTPLLAAAKQGPAATYRRVLTEELARLDAEARQEQAERRDHIAAARRAMANGKEVDAATALLIRVQDES